VPAIETPARRGEAWRASKPGRVMALVMRTGG